MGLYLAKPLLVYSIHVYGTKLTAHTILCQAKNQIISFLIFTLGYWCLIAKLFDGSIVAVFVANVYGVII